MVSFVKLMIFSFNSYPSYISIVYGIRGIRTRYCCNMPTSLLFSTAKIAVSEALVEAVRMLLLQQYTTISSGSR